jgi:hypothetical protein
MDVLTVEDPALSRKVQGRLQPRLDARVRVHDLVIARVLAGFVVILAAILGGAIACKI